MVTYVYIYSYDMNINVKTTLGWGSDLARDNDGVYFFVIMQISFHLL